MNKIDHLDLDGNTLTTFLTVLEEMSVSRAAERLGVSQSAVSHKIKRLEENLDYALLSRRSGGPLLTEAGDRLLQYANRILALHDEAIASLGKSTLAGKIKLGITQ